MNALKRLWASLNYRWCMAEAYLAYQRGEHAMSADYQAKADEWQRELFLIGVNHAG